MAGGTSANVCYLYKLCMHIYTTPTVCSLGRTLSLSHLTTRAQRMGLLRRLRHWHVLFPYTVVDSRCWSIYIYRSASNIVSLQYLFFVPRTTNSVSTLSPESESALASRSCCLRFGFVLIVPPSIETSSPLLLVPGGTGLLVPGGKSWGGGFSSSI